MTTARSRQICLEATHYYHCISRCVRRAYLCGEDRLTGQSFEHRRQWIVDRLQQLSTRFAIDLCAYSVMSNHYHVVLAVNEDQAEAWSQEEVIERWRGLFRGPDVIQRYQAGKNLSAWEHQQVDALVVLWRSRLTDISWFMRCLNESVARRANAEDECSGRFWEGRFKSQALLDEQALLTCMAYVDLNPVRAKKASTPEASDYTSIQARIRGTETSLLPFASESPSEKSIPYDYLEYLSLVDWTGRQIHVGKKGIIPNDLLPILSRLDINQSEWLLEMKYFGRWYYRFVGPMSKLREVAELIGQRWVKGRMYRVQQPI